MSWKMPARTEIEVFVNTRGNIVLKEVGSMGEEAFVEIERDRLETVMEFLRSAASEIDEVRARGGRFDDEEENGGTVVPDPVVVARPVLVSNDE